MLFRSAGTLAAQWPFAPRWSFGGSIFAQDMGTEVSTLHDPNTGEPLGDVATTHRWSYGLEWRAETTLRESGPLRWQGTGGFGYARQERDERGQVNDAVSGISAMVGLTGLWQTRHAHAFGASLLYRHYFVDTQPSPDRATSSTMRRIRSSRCVPILDTDCTIWYSQLPCTPSTNWRSTHPSGASGS